MEISGGFLELSEIFLGDFRENSGKFPEIQLVVGDTQGAQHDTTQRNGKSKFDVRPGPK